MFAKIRLAKLLCHSRNILLLGLPLLLISQPQHADAQIIEWNVAGGGLWGDSANWNPMNVPDGAGEDAVVPVGFGSGVISLDSNFALDSILIQELSNTFEISGRSLTLLDLAGLNTVGTIVAAANTSLTGAVTTASSSILNVPGGGTFDIYGGPITNDGTWNINSDTAPATTTLRARAATTLQGTGEIVLSTSTALSNANFSSFDFSSIWTQEANHTIRGKGTMQAILINNGTVEANVPSGTFDLISNGKTNNGTMRATNGGILDIGVTIDQGASGVIEADNGTVALTATTIFGGRLDSANGGRVAHTAGSAALDSVRNDGQFEVDPGMTTRILGGALENNGTMAVNPNGVAANTTLRFDEATDLTGTGDILLSTGGSINHGLLGSGNGTSVITQGSLHKIHGEGNITALLTNNGQVVADVSGEVLDLSINAKTNNAIMKAEAGGILDISSVITQGVGGSITADNATVTISGGTVSGGQLASLGTGVIQHNTSAATLEAVQNSATFQILPGMTTNISGGSLVNNGTFQINPAGSSIDTRMQFSGVTSLTGVGSIQLTTGGSPPDATLQSANGISIVTQGANHTIEGEGFVTAFLTNDGTVSANQSGKVLDLAINAKTNNALLIAESGGILDISSVITQGASGVIRADGGTVTLSSGTIIGGKLETANSSVIRHSVSSGTLSAVQNDGDFEVAAGVVTNISGGSLENNGSILVNPTGSSTNALMQFNGVTDLTGSGEIVLKTGGSVGDALLQSANLSSVVTQALGHTIRGEGRVSAIFENEGTVSADVNARTLELNSNAKTNSAVFEARSGGTLQTTSPITNTGTTVAFDSADVVISANTFDNDGLLSADGGDVLVSGGVLNNFNGTSEARNGGLFQANVLSAHFASNTLTGGAWHIYANSTMRLINVNIATNDAEILLDGLGSNLYQDAATTEALQSWTLNDGNGSFTVRNGRDYTLNSGWSNEGYVEIGATCTMTATGDYLQNAGETHVLGTLTATSGTVDIVEGALSGTGTVDADVFVGGLTIPGESVGVLTVDGTYEQDASATLQIEIEGLGALQTDRLDVSGLATLDGVVQVDYLGGFQPSVGDSFLVVSAGSLSGGFQDVLGSCSSGVCLEAAQVGSEIYLVGVPGNVTGAEDNFELPAQFALHSRLLQGGGVAFMIDTPEPAELTIEVFDVRGRKVASLERGHEPAGRHQVRWNGTSLAGSKVSSGVYFGRLTVATQGSTRVLNTKATVLR